MACCSLCVYHCMHLCLCSHSSSSSTHLPSVCVYLSIATLHLLSPQSLSFFSLALSISYLFATVPLSSPSLHSPYSLFTLLLRLHTRFPLTLVFFIHCLPCSPIFSFHITVSVSPSISHSLSLSLSSCTPPSLSAICLSRSVSHSFIDTGHYVTSMPSGCSLFL